MLKRNLDIGILMQDNGEYEITIVKPETGCCVNFLYKAGSAYKSATFEDVIDEIRGWVIMLDEEREAINEERSI